MASGSVGILPELHGHPHPHRPSGHEYPIRWTGPTHGQHRRRPVNVMTDVVNDLGVKILDRYIENDGNVGFSPSGLGFVLAALYEGSAGTSGRQIGDTLGLPSDRRVTRIGFRDIHRRLRSYLNADAFLGGLTLNRDDINLRPEYEDVLRFYGFDISDSGNATMPETTTGAGNLTDATEISVASTIVGATDSTTREITTPSISNPTLINDEVEIFSTMTTDRNTVTASTIETTTTTANVPTTIETMSQSVGVIGDAASSNDTTIDTAGSTNSSSTDTMSGSTLISDSSVTVTSSSMMIMNIVQTVANTMNASTTAASMQRPVETSTSAADVQTQSFDGSAASLGAGSSMTTMPGVANTSTQTDPDSRTNSSNGSASMVNDTLGITTPMTPGINLTTPAATNSTNFTLRTPLTMPDTTTRQTDGPMTTTVPDTMTNNVRKRRGVLQGPSGYFSSSADDGIWLDVFGRLNNNDDYDSQDDDIVENPNPSIELDFLINGCDYSRVTAATYTAVLPFAHFSSLRTSLLEFPLDDPRYKILVMLPSESNGTRRLARILSSKSITLRHLRRSLRPTWVTAIIPSFMLRGFVTLTPYLQKLGIVDVFEPRTADLSLMSPDLGVYARDIQQSIGVNIRNNMKGGIGGADGGNEDGQQQPQTANLARGTRGVVGLPPFFAAPGAISPRSLETIHYSPYPGGAGPVSFVVDRPFLYFIIDDQTSVSLLAGRIDDPLNSRIML